MAKDRQPKQRNSTEAIPCALLRWYAGNARTLPWRVGPKERKAGVRPDPYAVWLSEIMLQQTAVATVSGRFNEFLNRWPDVKAIAAAPVNDIVDQWAGLGYYRRARNLHNCSVVVAGEHDGVFPDTEEELRALPGVGGYTAAAIAAIAFDRRAVVVDGNIERVVTRLFEIETPLPTARAEIKRRAGEMWPSQRSGDFAQGLMDLGAAICRPKAPSCRPCPIADHCGARAAGTQENYPVRAARKAKPSRVGAVFALTNAAGEMLFERRPEKGLLGGMLGLPGTEPASNLPKNVFAAAPADAKWKKAGEAGLTFTHFHLMLDVYSGTTPRGFRKSANQQWIAPDKARLPAAMRKAVSVARGAMRAGDGCRRRPRDAGVSCEPAVESRNDRPQGWESHRSHR